MIGKTLSHYRILRSLGRGSMGEVYLAEDLDLDRQVALKVLAADLADNPQARKRFRNEAKAAAGLAHPHLATIYEVDLASDPCFLALEYVEGQTLQKRLAQGRLSVEDTLRIAKQMARGLAHAHQKGIVHRDIKGSNVILTPDDGLKILDFGIAHRIDATRITHEGSAVGTLSTMSPEQVEGKPVDGRSDVWSLGVVLYECLTGTLPFEGGSVAASYALIVGRDPAPIRATRAQVPDEIERVVLRCLEKDPALRYQTAEGLLADLILTERKLFPDRQTDLPPELRSSRRFSRFLPALVFAAGVGVLWLLLRMLLSRIQWSPHLADLVGVSLLLLLPAIAMRQRRLALLNLVAASAVAFAIFHGKELGSVHELVTVDLGEGISETREVPKPAFRRLLSTYPLDSDDAWLAYGVHDLLVADLSQDLFLELRPVTLDRERLVRDGHPDGMKLARAYQRELAVASGSTHFLRGAVQQEGDEYIVTLELRDARRGALVTEASYVGADVFDLVDRASLDLRAALDLPTPHLEDSPDAPVRDLETGSLEALRWGTLGAAKYYYERDLPGATDLLKRAAAADPTYATAQFLLYVCLNDRQQLEANPALATAARQGALSHLYRLPERTRLSIQATMALMDSRLDECLALARTRVQLYGTDASAHEFLGRVLALQGEDAAAREAFERSLELDPTRVGVRLEIGALLARSADRTGAIQTYQVAAEESPADPRPHLRLGDLYVEATDFALARESYQRAAHLDPTGAMAAIGLASVDRLQGHFADAEQQLRRLMATRASAADSAQVLMSLAEILDAAGRSDEAQLVLRSEVSVRERDGDPMGALQTRLRLADVLLDGGNPAGGRAALEQAMQDCPSQLVPIAALGSVESYLRLDDVEGARRQLEVFKGWAAANKFEVLDQRLALAEAEVALAAGHHEDAVQVLKQLTKTAVRQEALQPLARALRAAGRTSESKAILEDLLRSDPADAKVHLLQAELLANDHDVEGARRHAAHALKLWSDADPEFPPVLRARALVSRLGES